MTFRAKAVARGRAIAALLVLLGNVGCGEGTETETDATATSSGPLYAAMSTVAGVDGDSSYLAQWVQDTLVYPGEANEGKVEPAFIGYGIVHSIVKVRD